MRFCQKIFIGYRKLKSADKLKCIVLAVFFSFMKVISADFGSDNSLDFGILRILMLFLLHFVIGYFFFCVGFLLLDKVGQRFNKSLYVEGERKKFSYKRYILMSAENLVFWLPYYILFFPGTSNYGDTEKQIRMFFHRDVGFPLNVSPVQGPDIFISDHHPVFTTWLYGSFVKLGLFFGKAYIGVALFSLLQLVLFSFALTWIWARLEQLLSEHIFIKIGRMFTAFFPYYPIMGVCMVKDVTFAFFCIILLLHLFELRISDGELLKNKRYVFSLMLTVLFFILSKGQGKYLAVLLLVMVLMAYKEYWKQIIFAILVPVIFVQTIWLHVLFPIWNVSPGGRQEVLGPLFQQTARYVVTYGDEVTEYEQNTIDALIDYENISELYDPVLTDDIKNTFNQDATKEQLQDYYKCWLSMFFKHPEVYFEATLNTSYKFFDISWNATPFFTYFNSRVDETDELYIKSFFTDGDLGEKIKSLFLLLEKKPVLGLIFVPSFYTWFTLFCFMAALKKKNIKQIMTISLPFFSVLIYFVCPGNLARYTMPIILMSTVMFVNLLYGYEDGLN